MRQKIEVEPSTTNLSLDTLVPSYALNKAELDSYKKICDDENASIKRLMKEQSIDSYETNGYVAKVTESNRESMNEAKLVEVLKKHGITGAVKTIEVPDMDALEDYLYNTTISKELADDINSCKSTTVVTTLRISKAKKKKGEDDE